MKIGCSTKCYEQRSCKRIGLPTPTMTSLFPESLCGVTPPPAPVLLRVRVHPSMNFTSPAEYEPLQTCPARRRAERLPWGFVPHRDINPKSPLPSELPRAHPTGPSSAFLTLSTACSVTGLCGFVSLRSHVQGLSFRGLSLARKPCRISATAALCSLDGSDCSCLRHRNRPRIQGFSLPNECGGDRNR